MSCQCFQLKEGTSKKNKRTDLKQEVALIRAKALIMKKSHSLKLMNQF